MRSLFSSPLLLTYSRIRRRTGLAAAVALAAILLVTYFADLNFGSWTSSDGEIRVFFVAHMAMIWFVRYLSFLWLYTSAFGIMSSENRSGLLEQNLLSPVPASTTVCGMLQSSLLMPLGLIVASLVASIYLHWGEREPFINVLSTELSFLSTLVMIGLVGLASGLESNGSRPGLAALIIAGMVGALTLGSTGGAFLLCHLFPSAVLTSVLYSSKENYDVLFFGMRVPPIALLLVLQTLVSVFLFFETKNNLPRLGGSPLKRRLQFVGFYAVLVVLQCALRPGNWGKLSLNVTQPVSFSASYWMLLGLALAALVKLLPATSRDLVLAFRGQGQKWIVEFWQLSLLPTALLIGIVGGLGLTVAAWGFGQLSTVYHPGNLALNVLANVLFVGFAREYWLLKFDPKKAWAFFVLSLVVVYAVYPLVCLLFQFNALGISLYLLALSKQMGEGQAPNAEQLFSWVGFVQLAFALVWGALWAREWLQLRSSPRILNQSTP